LQAESAAELVRTDALLAVAQQEEALQPDMQGDVARLEYGADFDVEGLAALVTLVDADAR
jgi:hypothetical protein